jgi:THO complex subunit 5
MSQDSELLEAPSADEVIDKLRDLVEGDASTTLDPATLRICASALVGQLKALTRDANLVMRARKETTNAARQEMDQAHLQLQNLQYEKRHLEREIEKCRQFA